MDALDTLYIMEMFEEFDAATDWVEKNLDFNMVRVCVCACIKIVRINRLAPLKSVFSFPVHTHTERHKPL